MPNNICDILNILYHNLLSIIADLILNVLSCSGARMMHLPMKSMPLLVDADEEVKSSPESGETHTLTRTSCWWQWAVQISIWHACLSAAVEVETKCMLESQKQVRPGFFKPECDAQGNYLPMQCWHSTGYCWCVDKDGHEIPDTRIRGRPQCDSGVFYV